MTSTIVPLDDTDYLKGLLASMGVTEFEEGVLESLKRAVTAEFETISQSASRMAQYAGKDSIDYATAKFAAETHCIMTPPDSQKSVTLAKAHNSRNIGWPLGKSVKVPLRQVAHLTAVRDADVSIFPEGGDTSVSADSRVVDLSNEPEDTKMTGATLGPAANERPAAMRIDLVTHTGSSDEKSASEQRVPAYFQHE